MGSGFSDILLFGSGKFGSGFFIVSIECNSIRLGGPAHGIVSDNMCFVLLNVFDLFYSF